MNHNQRDIVEKDWTVTISVNERDGQTQATARLRLGERESVGVGLSRLSPAEHGVAGIGRELAAARALSDLARRMMAATAHDMEGLTAAPAASPS
jgi:Domain of unknown function (DUF1876)